MSKLDTLIESEGYSSLTELLEAAITDSVCPAICMNDGCPNCGARHISPHHSDDLEGGT